MARQGATSLAVRSSHQRHLSAPQLQRRSRVDRKRGRPARCEHAQLQHLHVFTPHLACKLVLQKVRPGDARQPAETALTRRSCSAAAASIASAASQPAGYARSCSTHGGIPPRLTHENCGFISQTFLSTASSRDTSNRRSCNAAAALRASQPAVARAAAAPARARCI